MQFPNQIAQAVAIHDANGNLIIQIGPQPRIDIFGVPPSLSKLSIFSQSTAGAIPEIDFTDANGVQLYSIYNVPSILHVGGNTNNDPRLEVNDHTGDFDRGVSIFGNQNDGFTVSYADGFIYAERGVGLETWNTMTLPVGWSSFQPCQYKLDAMGFVHLQGLVDAVPNPIPAGTVITTLPTGYRPVNVSLFPIAFDNSATHGRAVVRTNGNVEIYDAPNDLPWLNSIQFSVI